MISGLHSVGLLSSNQSAVRLMLPPGAPGTLAITTGVAQHHKSAQRLRHRAQCLVDVAVHLAGRA
jgi:hypothetical protein